MQICWSWGLDNSFALLKTPYRKDVLKALSQECKKAGIKFCVYYSILDWHHPSQEPDSTQEDMLDKYASNLMKEGWKEEYAEYMKSQLRELIAGYELALIWFDGGWTDWWTMEDGLKITSPKIKPCAHAFVFKIVFD